MLTIVVMYTAVGAVAGVLAGLLGVGGGIIIVPMLVYCLTLQSVPYDLVMHIALGTSLASIMFTSISSFAAHHRRGAVHWDIVYKITIGIFTGTFLGSCIASHLSTFALSVFFVVFLFYVAIQLMVEREPKASRQLPGPLGMFGAGNVIGGVSSFVGIGGGSLSVPFMIWCNVPVHHAIGTSAAIGFPIALGGAVGYVYTGWQAAQLPNWSVGFVYLPALAGIACASVITAPLGASLAHRLPVKRLKQVFALLLAIMGTRMLVGLFS